MTHEEDFPGRLLHQAALWDNYELLEDLLKGEQKIYIDSADSIGRRPIHAAALTNKSRCLKLLLESGADPNQPCGPKAEYRTALHISAACGSASNIRVLLEHGASLVEKERNGLTALDIAERGQYAECVKILQNAANEGESQKLARHQKLRENVVQGDVQVVKTMIAELGNDSEIVVNMAPSGANTLIFIASEAGLSNIVNELVKAGADGRQHPVTRYSPLYIACYHGHKDIVKILLLHYPQLVRQATVEKWLPIHAAVIGGHNDVLKMLLEHDYPTDMLEKFRDNEWEYELAFDINARDATGQTALYLACVLNNFKAVSILLGFKCKAVSIRSDQGDQKDDKENSLSPTRRKIADGIQSIMERLNLSSKPQETEKFLCPVLVNLLCGEQGETVLQVSVRQRQTDIVKILLDSGADPNIEAQKPSDDCCSSPLSEACKNKDASAVDILLRHGALDESSKALTITVKAGDDSLTSKLLATKVHPDPEFKLNKKTMTQQLPRGSLAGLATLTYSSVFPNTPAMLMWHGQTCQLIKLKSNWLIEGALHVNPKLRLNPRNHDVALFAITRLDLSGNALSSLPNIIFQLASIRQLNVSQNKLEQLPDCDWELPVLEEFWVQNNRLEALPQQLFKLPSIQVLDVSNNKLQRLPSTLWTAPSLRELNASFNLLSDLPEAISSQPVTPLRVSPSITPTNSLPSSSSSSILQPKELNHVNLWSDKVELTEQIVVDDAAENCSRLATLNLAHNLFTSIPPILTCLAVSLTRLNMSYNSLRTMSHVTSYPACLKQLDLSNNNISCWPSLPCVESIDAQIICHSVPNKQNPPVLTNPIGGRRKLIFNTLCPHRRHIKLDALRTLILSENSLEYIQLSTDDIHSDDDWQDIASKPTTRPMFPNLSMLDISNNKLKELPANIHELQSLSVLNISGNVDITELPPQMGLLPRLWSLNTQGCNLHEPLRSMIQSHKYKTMDVVGYLKSVLEDARPYARIKLMIVGVQGIGKTSLLEQLRSEGSGRRRPHEHWAQRMGAKQGRTAKGTSVSTVGVDIGLWVYDKRGRSGGPSRGPVVFRTWDFGGQREYYATHQYFLSKRSLYLVVWRMTDGEPGLRAVRQWLVNIQARAANSPVLIVGTHYDQMAERGLLARAEDLQQLIRDRFINVVDAEKCGLPRVLDTIEVSCKTRHNIRLLCNLIYDTVYSLKPPGSKELLLEQRVPASYLALEDVVTQIAAERKAQMIDPVLNAEQFRSVIATEMQFRYKKGFRDDAELHQATVFLHENGVLLHYEDATLRDLYFLDPQWLCDMLAHVVTVREINPFARTGVMKLSDLQLIFKSGTLMAGAQSYILSLLNKFEVALTWDNCSLLIPSLLPEDEMQNIVRVKIPVRSRGWAVRNKKLTLGSTLISDRNSLPEPLPILSTRQGSLPGLQRVYLMSYFPTGFWSRLMVRLLADDAVVDVVRGFLTPPKILHTDAGLAQCLDLAAEWRLWQTGMELRYGIASLFSLRETSYRGIRLRLQQDGSWIDADLAFSSVLEMIVPMESVVVIQEEEQGQREVELQASQEHAARLLARAIDHVDTLLEDWYPSLGTRFVHTSEGKFLVTRLVPCPTCFSEATSLFEDWEEAKEQHCSMEKVRKSTGSATSNASGDSGVGNDSSAPESPEPPVYTWMVEDCILAASEGKGMICPVHGSFELPILAPDIVFLDLGERHLIRSESISRGPLLGRGAFGFVFKGTHKAKGSNRILNVAMKMLQPVPPGRGASNTAIMAYKVAKGKWERDPLQYSCKAYCTARQELTILLSVRHVHIVPLVGVCPRPLSLVLDLAPQGALDNALRQYRRCGARLLATALQQLALQVARALEYLHLQHVIYRDLKSENVLVWSLPQPFQPLACPVHVKLADYGISRLSLAAGSKGFGGTEGFMAPEMVRFNGEEEYTEKVDCFSFGMFLYELVTLHQPFEGHDAVKECVVEGARPPLTPRDTLYPMPLLDLMVICWSQSPKDRPSASQIVSTVSAPEFSQLLDCVNLAGPKRANGQSKGNELWLASSSGLDVLTASLHGWTQQFHMDGVKATAVGILEGEIWLGDADGGIFCFDTEMGYLTWSYALGDAAIVAVEPLSVLNRVAIGLANGRILIVNRSSPPQSLTMAEGSFVIAEVGNSDSLFSIAWVSTENNEGELWIGEASAFISIYTIKGEVIIGQDRVNHYSPVISEVKETFLTLSGTSFVISFVKPGCMVYLWNVPKRELSGSLDCTKLVPCSESLKPLTLDELASKCQVTAVCLLEQSIYIGTAWGCIIVAEKSTLYPISVFRPFEEEVILLAPLKIQGEKMLDHRVALLGGGYRSLLSQTADVIATPTDSSVVPKKTTDQHLLLWLHDPSM